MTTSLVTVRMNGMPDSIYLFQSGETVYDLKIKIECTDRINREDQLLFLGPNLLIQDHRTLSYYGVVNKSIINLHKKHKDTTFEVTVVIPENHLPMIVFPNMSSNESVSNLMVHIENRIGVFRGRQSLLFQNVELYSNDLLRDFSVTLQPTVTLAMKPRYELEMFKVRIVEGKTGWLIQEVSVHPLDRAYLLYWSLRRLHEPGRAFKLFYRSMVLLGIELMEALGVHPDSVVNLIFQDGMS